MTDYFEEDQKNTADRAEWLEMQRRRREKKVDVKLTRINTNPFTDTPKWDRFKTQVESLQQKLYSDLPVDDFRSLLDIYQQIPHKGLNFDPIRFVFGIDNRVFAEWCMSPDEGGKDWYLHTGYQGEGFTSFMDKEVHYELERQRSEGDRGNHEGYLRARQRVLGGLTLKAVELFSEWGGTSPPSRKDESVSYSRYIYDDKRNLRADLNDYIARYMDLTQPQVKAA